MKPVLLIYPPYEGKTLLKSRTPFPIGLLYIAAYLQKRGIQAEVMDFGYPHTKVKVKRPAELKTGQSTYVRYGWSDEQIGNWLKKNLSKYHNVVGVSSLMSSTYNGGYQVARLIKEANKSYTIVMGGPHATAFPDHVAANSKVDLVCIGEGEESFLNFIKHGRAEGMYTTGAISRLPSKYDGELYNRQFIAEMDSLPFPNRKILKDKRELDEMILTFSRGCPHKCSFCGSRLIQGTKWRHKSVERAVQEVTFYMEKWGIKKFIVEDDNLCPGQKGIDWLKKFSQAIINKNTKIRFHVSHGLPVYALADPELCNLIYRAGFRDMVFPLESTDPEVLKDMKKEFTPSNWRQAIVNWAAYEKQFPTEIILGYPFVETIETMLKTMIDCQHMRALVWASHFRLNRGVELYDRCLDAGYIGSDYDPINTQAFFIETERFNLDDLSELMQISRGINFGIERGFRCFEDDVSEAQFKDFKWCPPAHIQAGNVIAKGNFKFRRSQNIFAGLLLMRGGLKGRPMVSYSEDGTELIYSGVKSSKVYLTLSKLLKGVR